MEQNRLYWDSLAENYCERVISPFYDAETAELFYRAVKGLHADFLAGREMIAAMNNDPFCPDLWEPSSSQGGAGAWLRPMSSRGSRPAGRRASFGGRDRRGRRRA